LNNDELGEIIHLVKKFSIQGIVATNTTVEHSGLTDKIRTLKGGLSHKHLHKRSTIIIKKLYKELGINLSINGVGGDFSGADAYKKIRAGAAAIQIYNSLIYEGPALIKKVKKELAKLLEKDGFKKVSEAVGIDN
tara:strand:+ start:109 stop:513 length:405 start_codon:yes stop_codon:yes gene_type:complete